MKKHTFRFKKGNILTVIVNGLAVNKLFSHWQGKAGTMMSHHCHHMGGHKMISQEEKNLH